jgi:hypothetical protein
LKHQLSSIDYFKNSLLDPFFAVAEIIHNTTHPYQNAVLTDLNDINHSELASYVKEHEIDKLLEISQNKDLEERKHFLIHRLQTEIASERLVSLTDKSSRPKPYNQQNLTDLLIDDNNLADISSFDLSSGGFQYKDFIYNLAPITGGSNSSYWITQAIIYIYYDSGLPFKIRLDPFIEIKPKEYNPMMYKMYIYGKQLNWNRLKSLQTIDDGKWLNEKSYSDIGVTDYVWHPSEEEVHFTCEELPKGNQLKVRGSRYFHAIFDKKTEKVKHCDGAIRVYDEIEFSKRSAFHIKNSEVRKIGKRVKIFQLDEPVDQSVFGNLITNFFVWNYDVMSYFGAE